MSTPRLRTRSSLDRFTVAKNRTRIPSSSSSQPEPMEIPTADDLLRASESRTDDGDLRPLRGTNSRTDAELFPSLPGKKLRTDVRDPHPLPLRARRPWTDTRKHGDLTDSLFPYGRTPSDTSDAGDPLPSRAHENHQDGSAEAYPSISHLEAESSADGRTHLGRSRARRFFSFDRWVRRRDRGRVEAYDGANSTGDGTPRNPITNSTMTSHRDFMSSSTDSSGQGFSHSLEEYNQQAKQHGLDPLQYESTEAETTPEARPRFLHKSMSLNRLVTFTAKHFHRKASTPDLRNQKPRDALALKTLLELSRMGVASYYLPQRLAVGELILPTLISNLITYLYHEGLKSPGIFRVPGQSSNIQKLYDHYADQYAKFSEPSGVQTAVGSASLPSHLHYEINDVASLFKKIIIGLPGGLLGSPGLFKALAGIQVSFHDGDQKPESRRTGDQVKLIASAIDTIDTPYRKPLVIGFLGLVSAIGHETEKADLSEMMSYQSLARVLGPILLGIFPTDVQDSDRATPITRSTARSTDSKITVPPSVYESRDRYHNAIAVLEMLITRWQKVVDQLRFNETKRLRVSRRATSRVTSVESGSSGRLSGVEEDPQLEDQLRAMQEDPVSEMPRSRAASHKSEILNTGNLPMRSSSEMTMLSQSAISSSDGPIRDCSAPEERHQPQVNHPFLNKADKESRQNARVLSPNTPKKTNSDLASVGTEATNPPTPQSNPASHQPSSRKGSCSQQLLQGNNRTASANSRNVGCEAQLTRDQSFENGTTDGALDLDQDSPARPWSRASNHSQTATDGRGLFHQESEAGRGGSPKGKSGFEVYQNRSYASSPTLQVQDPPATSYCIATEAGSKIEIQQTSNEHEHRLSTSTNASRPEAVEISYSTRRNSVRELTQQYEAVQRQGSESVAKDIAPSAAKTRSVSDPSECTTVAPGAPSRMSIFNHDPPPSSPATKSQIPKPVIGHGRGRNGESSSPSPVKTITSRHSDASFNSNVASKSSSTPTNAQPTRAPAASASPRIREGSTRASSSLQPPSRPPPPPPFERNTFQPLPRVPPPPPVERNLRSFSSYATPSLERMRSRNHERAPAESFLSLGKSTSSQRSERASSSYRAARPISPTPISRRPVRVLLAPAHTTPAPTIPSRSPARPLTGLISYPTYIVPAQSSASDTLRPRQCPAPALTSGPIPHSTSDSRSASWTASLVPRPPMSSMTNAFLDASVVDEVNYSDSGEFLLLLRDHMSAEAAGGSIPALRNEIDVARLVEGAWATHVLYLERLKEAAECTEKQGKGG